MYYLLIVLSIIVILFAICVHQYISYKKQIKLVFQLQ